VSEVSLRGTVRYRDRPITHPAGSEKAFFSLAILTALAHYFQTPILIDEVAKNLDSKNLKAFFELVREFKERWSVQYVLSVKETSPRGLVEAYMQSWHSLVHLHKRNTHFCKPRTQKPLREINEEDLGILRTLIYS